MGQQIEILPNVINKSISTTSGDICCPPILSKITSLFAEKNTLQYAVPDGLSGVDTNIDPTLTRADRLVGQVFGEVCKLPDVYIQLGKLLGVTNDFYCLENCSNRDLKEFSFYDFESSVFGDASLPGMCIVSSLGGIEQCTYDDEYNGICNVMKQNILWHLLGHLMVIDLYHLVHLVLIINNILVVSQRVKH